MNDTFISLGYLGLFICSFIAGSPIPMNSKAVLSVALVLGWDPVWCVVSCIVGNSLGTGISYSVGRFFTFDQVLRWTKVNPEKLVRVRDFLRGRGVWFALLAVVPIIGHLVTISFGILRAPYWKIGSIMLLGQIFSYTVWTLLTLGVVSLF